MSALKRGTPNTAPDQPRKRRWRRQLALTELGFTSYREYLRSPHWQQVKARYRASSEPQDCICGETTGLHLHHLTYERVGAEELADLTPLCARCHALVHELVRRGEIGLDLEGFVSAARAQRYEEARRATDAPDAAQRQRCIDQQRKRLKGLFVAYTEEAAAARVDPAPFLGDLVQQVKDQIHLLSQPA